MRRRLVLFDVDGTLVDTLGAGRAAMVKAMRAVYGESGPVDRFDFRGRTDPEIVRTLLRAAGRADPEIDERLDTLWVQYYAQLERELTERGGRVLALRGVPELLRALSADERFAAGLVTGNMERGAWLKLGACGLDGFFSFGAFGSDSEDRDELPAIAAARAGALYGAPFAPQEIVVVGDTPADVRCARAAGARSLAVRTGGHPAAELRRCGADRVIEDLSETEQVLRWLSGEAAE